MIDRKAYFPLLANFEGAIRWPYLDTAGNVTVGVGTMLPVPEAAELCEFYNRLTKKPATGKEKREAWQTVKDQESGRLAIYYRKFSTLELTPEFMDNLLDKTADRIEEEIGWVFPDYDNFPKPIAAAVFDMAFNLGVPNFRRKFPKLITAIRAKDWARAAEECRRSKPISDARNNWTKAQFIFHS